MATDLRDIEGESEALNARIDGLEKSIKAQFDGVNWKLDMILKFQSLETRLGNIERRFLEREKSQ